MTQVLETKAYLNMYILGPNIISRFYRVWIVSLHVQLAKSVGFAVLLILTTSLSHAADRAILTLEVSDNRFFIRHRLTNISKYITFKIRILSHNSLNCCTNIRFNEFIAIHSYSYRICSYFCMNKNIILWVSIPMFYIPNCSEKDKI